MTVSTILLILVAGPSAVALVAGLIAMLVGVVHAIGQRTH